MSNFLHISQYFVMSKKVKLNLPINRDKNLPIYIDWPQNLLEVLHSLSYIITAVFLMFGLSSYIFGISEYGELDILIWLYLFIIIMSGIQIAKFLLGGENWFPKVTYDFFLLTIPPVIIGSLLISSYDQIDTFGELGTWHIAPITILSVVMISYLLALTFSNKKGENFLWNVLTWGLIISGSFYLFVQNSSLFGEKYFDVRMDTLVMLLAPLFVLRLLNSPSFLQKISSGLMTILAFIFLATGVDEFYDELGARNYFNDYKSETLWIIVYYIICILLYYLIFFINIKFDIRNYVTKFHKRLIDKTDKTGKLNVLVLLKDNYKIVIGITGLMFAFVGISWLVGKRFLEASLGNIVDDWSKLDDISGFGSWVVGDGIESVSNHFLSIMYSYGLVSIITIGLVLCVMVFSEAKKILVSSREVLLQNRFYYLLGLISLISWKFLFNLSISMNIVLAVFVAFLMISGRERDIDYSKFSIINFNSLKDDQIKIAVNILRWILLVLTLIGLVIISNGLFNVVE